MSRLVRVAFFFSAGLAVMSGGAALALEKAANQAAAKAAADKRGAMFEEMGDLMDRKLGPAVRNPAAFDAAGVKAAATRMSALAAQIPALFSTDTRGFRVTTSAKDNVWQTHPDFLTKAKALNGALANLQKVAGASTDRKVVGAAIMQVGKNCKACHDTYKVPD